MGRLAAPSLELLKVGMGFGAAWFSGKCLCPWQQHGIKLCLRSLPEEKKREFNQLCVGFVGKTQVQLLGDIFSQYTEDTGDGRKTSGPS